MSSFYTEITLPSFAPPAWIFGPVWTVLYIIITLSFGYAIYLVIQKKIPLRGLIPLGINVGTNVIWTPIFFRLQNFDLALIDILLVWGSIIWIGAFFWNKKRWISYAQIPYFLWVSFATILMISIWIFN